MYGTPRDYLEKRRCISIDTEKCVGCSLCIRYCPKKGVLALDASSGKASLVMAQHCATCLECLDRCPARAISLGFKRLEGESARKTL